MERLKQIWHNYKQISPAFRKSSGASYGEDLPDEPLNDDDASAWKHEQASLYNQADNGSSSYGGAVAAAAAAVGSTVAPDASATAAYSSPSPNQSIVRDDVNSYEAVNSGSRPGSTAARYPTANGRTLPADTYDDASTAGTAGRAYGNSGGKSSRPESRTSDRQYGASQPKQPPELSRNNSVADYVDPRRSESRLSRSSVTNEDAVRSGTVSKEPEYGRAVEPERLSRNSDTTKPDSTGAGGGGASGSSGRLSRESVADQRASRQSMQSLAGSQQYGAADGADTAPSQQYAAQGHPLHQHLQPSHPHQHLPSFHHNPQRKFLPLQQQQHQPHPHHPYRHRLAPPEAASSSQENLQSQWNRRKVTELWGIRVPVHPHGQEPTDSDTSNRPVQDDKAPPQPYRVCCTTNNGLPRQQLPKTCGFQPIESYPKLISISSPSLFGSSPDISQTPSPTSTVLKNYDAASPNPV
uniref:Uncharacterized protein n=1 Tax=Anopheles coluzzii TaxID=1518534 RepID=A0A8W7P8M9_ANOCL